VRSGWRGLALTVGVLLAIGGIALWASGGGFVLLIVAAVAIVTALLEPIYGRAVARPIGGNWHATDEKFVDPETGDLVTVWFDPASGERKYVTDEASDRA
jgi:multisubunit Na+/H+ antiporter MnhG subunit